MSAEIVYCRYFDDFVLEMREHTGWYVTELKVQKAQTKKMHNKSTLMTHFRNFVSTI